MFWYEAFGLRIRSEIEFPELTSSQELPEDFEIVRGSVEDHIDGVVASGVMFEASHTHFLVKLPPIAKFLLSGGRRMVVDPYPDADPESVRSVLLSDVIPPLLRQRGVLVLHAGGFVGQHGVTLVAGPSGAGKSTLIAELVSRGAGVVGDDFVAVRFLPHGGFVVEPGCGRLKLWEDSALELGYDLRTLPPVRPTLRRYRVDHWDRVTKVPMPLKAVVLLGMHPGDGIAVERLAGQRAFLAVRDQIRGLPAVAKLQVAQFHFDDIARIAASVPVYSIRRPPRPFSVRAVADRVLELAG